MKTECNGLETNLNEHGVFVLDENEAVETDGGDHWEIIGGVLTYVKD